MRHLKKAPIMILFTEYVSTSEGIPSNVVSSKNTLSEKLLHTENNLALQTKNPSDFFEEISLVFSSLGSLFGFHN
jgi:hypothetical protein